jgi:hypothetical protein
MRRQLTGFSLIVCGLWIILGGLVSLVSAPVASATPRLAPSPRPTIERPTAAPAQPGQPDGDHSSDSGDESAGATGRLTGTIIDTATGAPAPGVTVTVGGVQVTSDANGNYDTWLPVGSYTVGLVLSGLQGSDILGPQSVEVRSADTTVQHMYFRSLLAPTATAEPAVAPTLAPIASEPASEPAGSAPGQPVMRPTTLPVTSVASDTAGLWLGIGAALVVIGMMVGWGSLHAAKRRLSVAAAAVQHMAPEALLAALLSSRLPASARSDEALLRSLLNNGGDARGDEGR